jgi:uncharacterized protein YqeY
MSKLADKIQAELKTAMLARDEFKTTVLRGLKSAILYVEVAQNKRDEGLSDEETEKVIAKEIKQRDDSIETYTAAGDKARAEQEMAEREILAAFLPEPLSEAELQDVVQRVITTGGFSGPQDMGRAIGDVKAEVGTRANGADIARIVKAELNK